MLLTRVICSQKNTPLRRIFSVICSSKTKNSETYVVYIYIGPEYILDFYKFPGARCVPELTIKWDKNAHNNNRKKINLISIQYRYLLNQVSLS